MLFLETTVLDLIYLLVEKNDLLRFILCSSAAVFLSFSFSSSIYFCFLTHHLI